LSFPIKLADVPTVKWRFAPTANDRYIHWAKYRCAGRQMLNKTEYCVYHSEDSKGVLCKWALRVDGNFMGWWDRSEEAIPTPKLLAN
jgi:hypothetical protein